MAGQSHVEQVASRLNWPCVRVNLDGHVSRMDLIGKDAIVIRDGKQVTEFQPGMLTWALQRPCALVFDEYDAGRADVMFVIQRVLEVEGRLTLLDQSRVIEPHPSFRCSPPPIRSALAMRPASITDTAAQSGPDGPLEHRRHAETTAHDREVGSCWRDARDRNAEDAPGQRRDRSRTCDADSLTESVDRDVASDRSEGRSTPSTIPAGIQLTFSTGARRRTSSPPRLLFSAAWATISRTRNGRRREG
jgi:hypothetical protein